MSKVQLYIGNDLLDFNETINVKRQVNDYRDPSIGGNVTSYTIQVPLTPKNRRLLGYIDDLRSRVEVTKVSRILIGGMEIIRGKLRVLRTNASRCTIIIEGNDWVNDIAGISIKALSWAGGDEHLFSSTNITVSWTAAAGAFYRYPLVNFSELISGDYGGSGSSVYSYEFYMAWHIETIVTKLLLDAGYTLAANGFFASTFGRALYLFSAAVPAITDFISGKALKVYVNDNADNFDTINLGLGATGALTVNQVMVIDGEDEDEGNDFSTSTHRYTAPETGTYRFQSYCEIWSSAHRQPANYTVNSSSIQWSIRKNGATTLATYSESNINVFNSGNSFDLDTGYVHLEASDYIDIQIFITANVTNISPGSIDPELYVDAGLADNYLQAVWSEQNLWPGTGKTISPAEYLPDMDSVLFLQGLKRALNLRFFVDRNNKTVYIETSDDFYGSTVIDWTDKVDYSSLPEPAVLAASYKKNQKLKWKPDSSDKAYTNEVSTNGVPFQKELALTSEYLQAGTTERENQAFAPTVLGDMPQIGHWGEKKVPRIFGGSEFVSSSRPYPAFRAKGWEARIMEWKGMVALTSGNFDYYQDFEDPSATNYTTFPSMETPDMNDMFSDYMLKDWSRIDKNKIVTVTLKLTPLEIMKFMTVVGTAANEGFRATYKLNIEGVDMYFIVSSIVTDGDRVKAELIQKL